MPADATPHPAPDPLWQPVWSSTPHAVRAFGTTRHGGVSEAPFASANGSLSVGDDHERVLANRRRFAERSGFRLGDGVLPCLEHGVRVLVATGEHRGLGTLDSAPMTADATVTDERRVILLTTVADCTPVFLARRDGSAVGLVHAGWRGTLDGVLTAALDALADLGNRASPLVAALGPSIGPCCFEVGEEVAERFSGAPPNSVLRRPGSRPHIDLAHVIASECAARGLDRPLRPPCTRCHSDVYFSHRAHGGKPTGRMLAALWRPENETS